MTPISARLPRTLVAMIVLAALLGTAGCGLLRGKPDDITVSDQVGMFQFKVPGDWQARWQPGLIVVYASDTPPAEEPIDKLSIVVMSVRLATDVELPTLEEALDLFLADRQERRGWQDPQIGEVEDVMVGGKPAIRKSVDATDAQGTKFRGEYTLLRPSEGVEILIMAVASANAWDDTADDLNTLLAEKWFWLGALGASEATATAEPTATP